MKKRFDPMLLVAAIAAAALLTMTGSLILGLVFIVMMIIFNVLSAVIGGLFASVAALIALVGFLVLVVVMYKGLGSL